MYGFWYTLETYVVHTNSGLTPDTFIIIMKVTRFPVSFIWSEVYYCQFTDI